jgi:hypothetical protein
MPTPRTASLLFAKDGDVFLLSSRCSPSSSEVELSNSHGKLEDFGLIKIQKITSGSAPEEYSPYIKGLAIQYRLELRENVSELPSIAGFPFVFNLGRLTGRLYVVAYTFPSLASSHGTEQKDPPALDKYISDRISNMLSESLGKKLLRIELGDHFSACGYLVEYKSTTSPLQQAGIPINIVTLTFLVNV